MLESVINTIRHTFVPVHKEGWPFIAIAAAVAFVLFFVWQPLGWIAAILCAWMAFFFRDPPRVTPVRPGLVVSPADGTVSLISDAVPPPELDLGDQPLPRVSVFMNVFNVHVNRAPASGNVERMVYRPGKFFNAELDKASEFNERNGLVIATPEGVRLGVVQIAGLVARRIVPFVKEGDAVTAGQRFGLIRFGSRLDVYLPAGTAPLVAVGQLAIAGETVIADLSATSYDFGDRTWRAD